MILGSEVGSNASSSTHLNSLAHFQVVKQKMVYFQLTISIRVILSQAIIFAHNLLCGYGYISTFLDMFPPKLQ
jgi:hypothetical protein